MNYMLLMYVPEVPPEGISTEEIPHDCEGLSERLQEGGQLIATGRLQPTATATSVRLRSGRRIVTDGPFAETREQLGGFMMIAAKDLDEAISIADQHPVARVGTVEIRPMAAY